MWLLQSCCQPLILVKVLSGLILSQQGKEEHNTNFNSTYIFSLFTQSIATNYISNSQNTLVLRLKQSIKGW